MAGSGFIRKRGQSSWEIIVSLGYDAVTGKRIRRIETVRGTRSAAEVRLREIMTGIDHGQPGVQQKVNTGDYFNKWFIEYVLVNTRPKTAQGYRSIIRCHILPGLGHFALAKV